MAKSRAHAQAYGAGPTTLKATLKKMVDKRSWRSEFHQTWANALETHFAHWNYDDPERRPHEYTDDVRARLRSRLKRYAKNHGRHHRKALAALVAVRLAAVEEPKPPHFTGTVRERARTAFQRDLNQRMSKIVDDAIFKTISGLRPDTMIRDEISAEPAPLRSRT